jgi:outer membrane lipoprotein-sorting protein
VKYKIGSTLQFLLVLVLLAQASCIKTTRKLPADQRMLPAKSASRSELFQQLEAKSRQIQTLKGTMNIALSGGGPKSGVLTEYHETRGVIVVERPSNIRVQVQLPIVSTTVANMVSDGRQYRVWLPLDKQYMIGDVDAPPSSNNTVKDLRPQQFMEGLFVDIRPYLGNSEVKQTFEEATEGVRSFYVFTFVNFAGTEARTLEKIWIDRLDLQVSRKQVFGKEGRIEVDAQYTGYQPMNGISFPQNVELQLPLQDYTVKMEFQKTTLNESVPEDAFTLPQPEGAKLVQVTK